MTRAVGRAVHWWSGRTVQFRTSAVAALVALVGLLVVARISTGFIGWFSLDSIDSGLRAEARAAARSVASGAAPARVEGGGIRVLDSAGEPVDGAGATGLRPWEINTLKAGNAVTRDAGKTSRRWVGEVIPDERGRPRLVLARTDLTAYQDLYATASNLLTIGSVLAAGMVGAATWFMVRSALSPVRRMRLAAKGLGPRERLPVPEPDDELRALALDLNELLNRRDADTDRLRRFTGDAAHELRNPVGSIRAQAEVAVLHPDPDAAQDTFGQIADEAQRLSELVEGLLALARAESGRNPDPRPVELVGATRLAVDRVNMAGHRPRVRFVTAVSSIAVLSTPAEVATVLDNLIANAQRYARALVRVSLLPASGAVRVVVDDDGPGIPVEHRERIFDRFYRAEPDRTRDTGGSGLGLALVADVVHRRGGSLRADVSPESGARVEVRWPVD